MKPGRKSLAAMLLLLVISAAVVWFGMGDEMKGARDMRFGIDIRGGVEAVFEPVGLDRAPTEQRSQRPATSWNPGWTTETFWTGR